MANVRKVISRRRWQESIKALKSFIKNDKLATVQRIRCVELLMLIQGLDLPESSKRNQKAIKDLIQEREAEKTIREQVEQKVQEPEPTPGDELAKILENLSLGSKDGKQ